MKLQYIWLILLGLAGLPLACFSEESPAVPQSAEAATTAARTEDGSSPSLAEILTTMEALETEDRKLRLLLAEDGRLSFLAAEIKEIDKTFLESRRQAGSVLDDLVGFHELTDLSLALRTAEHRLTSTVDELVARADALDTGLDQVAAIGERAGAWIETAERRDSTPAVLERIQALIPRYEALAREMRKRRDQVIEVLGEATQLRAAVIALRVEVSERRDQLTGRLRAGSSEPLWRLKALPGEHSRVLQFFNAQIAQSVGHLRDHAASMLAIAGLAFMLTWWLIVTTRESIAALAGTDPYMQRTVSLFRLPAAVALVAALVAVLVFSPPGPTDFQLVLLALVALPGSLLARAVLGPHISLSLYTLTGVLISMALLGAVVDPLPLASRLLFIAQCASLAVALGVDLHRGHVRQSFPDLPASLVRWATAGLIVLLSAAVLAVVAGQIGAASILRNLVVGALGLWLLLAVIAGQLYGFTLALLHTRAARSLRIVHLRQRALLNSLRKIFTAVAVLGWGWGMLIMLGRGDEVSRLLDALIHAEFTIGSTSIHLAGIWVGLAVILGTIVVMKIVTPVLELEIVPRLSDKQGLPFAVATVTRYLLVSAGFLLALAAMGIDLTKVTVLAGAVGVGIGFGLQGVVNNFVSGLILLMERPVNVGDVMQMGQLHGRISRIGVRSSTVQTFQGAEVIVPNADLISNEVTNWTLSDRKRRLEIDVGVDYGAEPEQVVKILEDAARAVADVVREPPPFAWCTGFGDSSIDFRLDIWIDDYDQRKVTQSALRMTIVKKLREANIEIPYPQRDIKIRNLPAGPAGQAQ